MKTSQVELSHKDLGINLINKYTYKGGSIIKYCHSIFDNYYVISNKNNKLEERI